MAQSKWQKFSKCVKITIDGSVSSPSNLRNITHCDQIKWTNFRVQINWYMALQIALQAHSFPRLCRHNTGKSSQLPVCFVRPKRNMDNLPLISVSVLDHQSKYLHCFLGLVPDFFVRLLLKKEVLANCIPLQTILLFRRFPQNLNAARVIVFSVNSSPESEKLKAKEKGTPNVAENNIIL